MESTNNRPFRKSRLQPDQLLPSKVIGETESFAESVAEPIENPTLERWRELTPSPQRSKRQTTSVASSNSPGVKRVVRINFPVSEQRLPSSTFAYHSKRTPATLVQRTAAHEDVKSNDATNHTKTNENLVSPMDPQIAIVTNRSKARKTMDRSACSSIAQDELPTKGEDSLDSKKMPVHRTASSCAQNSHKFGQSTIMDHIRETIPKSVRTDLPNALSTKKIIRPKRDLRATTEQGHLNTSTFYTQVALTTDRDSEHPTLEVKPEDMDFRVGMKKTRGRPRTNDIQGDPSLVQGLIERGSIDPSSLDTQAASTDGNSAQPTLEVHWQGMDLHDAARKKRCQPSKNESKATSSLFKGLVKRGSVDITTLDTQETSRSGDESAEAALEAQQRGMELHVGAKKIRGPPRKNESKAGSSVHRGPATLKRQPALRPSVKPNVSRKKARLNIAHSRISRDKIDRYLPCRKCLACARQNDCGNCDRCIAQIGDCILRQCTTPRLAKSKFIPTIQLSDSESLPSPESDVSDIDWEEAFPVEEFGALTRKDLLHGLRTKWRSLRVLGSAELSPPAAELEECRPRMETYSTFEVQPQTMEVHVIAKKRARPRNNESKMEPPLLAGLAEKQCIDMSTLDTQLTSRTHRESARPTLKVQPQGTELEVVATKQRGRPRKNESKPEPSLSVGFDERQGCIDPSTLDTQLKATADGEPAPPTLKAQQQGTELHVVARKQRGRPRKNESKIEPSLFVELSERRCIDSSTLDTQLTSTADGELALPNMKVQQHETEFHAVVKKQRSRPRKNQSKTEPSLSVGLVERRCMDPFTLDTQLTSTTDGESAHPSSTVEQQDTELHDVARKQRGRPRKNASKPEPSRSVGLVERRCTDPSTLDTQLTSTADGESATPTLKTQQQGTELHVVERKRRGRPRKNESKPEPSLSVGLVERRCIDPSTLDTQLTSTTDGESAHSSSTVEQQDTELHFVAIEQRGRPRKNALKPEPSRSVGLVERRCNNPSTLDPQLTSKTDRESTNRTLELQQQNMELLVAATKRRGRPRENESDMEPSLSYERQFIDLFTSDSQLTSSTDGESAPSTFKVQQQGTEVLVVAKKQRGRPRKNEAKPKPSLSGGLVERRCIDPSTLDTRLASTAHGESIHPTLKVQQQGTEDHDVAKQQRGRPRKNASKPEPLLTVGLVDRRSLVSTIDTQMKSPTTGESTVPTLDVQQQDKALIVIATKRRGRPRKNDGTSETGREATYATVDVQPNSTELDVVLKRGQPNKNESKAEPLLSVGLVERLCIDPPTLDFQVASTTNGESAHQTSKVQQQGTVHFEEKKQRVRPRKSDSKAGPSWSVGLVERRYIDPSTLNTELTSTTGGESALVAKKRGRPRKDESKAEPSFSTGLVEPPSLASTLNTQLTSTTDGESALVAKKQRGRPRKYESKVEPSLSRGLVERRSLASTLNTQLASTTDRESALVAKKQRGRPRKNESNAEPSLSRGLVERLSLVSTLCNQMSSTADRESALPTLEVQEQGMELLVVATKRRGRPRKNESQADPSLSVSLVEGRCIDPINLPKKKRGRPAKPTDVNVALSTKQRKRPKIDARATTAQGLLNASTLGTQVISIGNGASARPTLEVQHQGEEFHAVATKRRGRPRKKESKAEPPLSVGKVERLSLVSTLCNQMTSTADGESALPTLKVQQQGMELLAVATKRRGRPRKNESQADPSLSVSLVEGRCIDPINRPKKKRGRPAKPTDVNVALSTKQRNRPKIDARATTAQGLLNASTLGTQVTSIGNGESARPTLEVQHQGKEFHAVATKRRGRPRKKESKAEPPMSVKLLELSSIAPSTWETQGVSGTGGASAQPVSKRKEQGMELHVVAKKNRGRPGKKESKAESSVHRGPATLKRQPALRPSVKPNVSSKKSRSTTTHPRRARGTRDRYLPCRECLACVRQNDCGKCGQCISQIGDCILRQCITPRVLERTHISHKKQFSDSESLPSTESDVSDIDWEEAFPVDEFGKMTRKELLHELRKTRKSYRDQGSAKSSPRVAELEDCICI